MSSSGLIRILLCAVGLEEKFYVARCQSISGAKVESGFGGIAKLVMDVTDFLKNFGVVWVCLRKYFECGECGCLVAIDTLLRWPD